MEHFYSAVIPAKAAFLREQFIALFPPFLTSVNAARTAS
jgi:hypothetical protein